MSDNYFNPVFTDIGRTVAADDSVQGLKTVITHVAFGDAKYAVRDANGVALDVAASATALQSERWRTVAEAGGSPSPGVLNLVAEVTKAADTEPQFFISEVGFFNADGVLIAVWSSDTVNLGYRGDLAAWYLSLGLAWFDLPGDMFTVEVLNAPLSQQMLGQARLRNQVSDLVESSGLLYEPDDPRSLTAAIDKRFGQLDKVVRAPICVFPANNEENVGTTATFVGSAFFSADGYQHVASRGLIRDESGSIVYDSGELGPVTDFSVPADVLDTLSSYSWEFAYKGVLGSFEFWSDYSLAASFMTTDVSAYNEAPTLLSPLDGANKVALQPNFAVSPYSVYPADFDVVDALQVQVYDDSGLTNLVWDSGVVTSNFESVRATSNLEAGKTYYWTARQRGTVLGWTEFSVASVFEVTSYGIGTVLYDGGIVAAQHDGYWLVVAPASKRGMGLKFGLYDVFTAYGPQYSSEPDPRSGKDNTDGYIAEYSGYVDSYGNVGPIAVKFCRDVGADYFLPNKEEMAAILANRGAVDAADTTSGIKFSSIGHMWTSTQASRTSNYILTSAGVFGYGGRDSVFFAVPVRRDPV